MYVLSKRHQQHVHQKSIRQPYKQANKHTPANTDAATEARFSALESKMCKFDLMESKLDAILDKLPASDSVSGLNNVETKIDTIINQIPSDDFNEQVKTI